MPFINIKVAAPALSDEQVQQLQKRTTALMASVLHKKAELTSVLVEHVATRGWTVGGQPMGVAAHLEAKITAGTNTAEEKALFVAEANRLLHDVLGPDLPEATYVVVDEINADAWGYNGRTQLDRRISALTPA